MTPIFSRSWFVNRQIVSVRLSVPASLRSAWLISRAWRPDVAVPHLALDLRLRRQRGDRVDRDDVDGAGADQQLGDLERLLAGVGLRDEQLVDVDADPPRVRRVHRVLGVDERADPAAALRLCDHVVDERRLARRLGAEDLDDPPSREPADTEGEVERERAGRDRSDRDQRAGRSCASPSPCRTAARSWPSATSSASSRFIDSSSCGQRDAFEHLVPSAGRVQTR